MEQKYTKIYLKHYQEAIQKSEGVKTGKDTILLDMVISISLIVLMKLWELRGGIMNIKR